jgi:hypothetical protein
MPFTRSEMVAAAKAAGYLQVSERLVTDWVTVGLLGRSTRVPRPKGEGRGARYIWSDLQKELFLSLLQHRPGGKDIIRLLNLPVSIWLYWGDNWGVNAEQVQLALTTWAGFQRRANATRDRSLVQARAVVNTLADPKASQKQRRELREAVVDALDRGSWSQEEIGPLAMKIADPDGSGRTYGPGALPADDVVRFLGAFFDGVKALEAASRISLEHARMLQRDITIGYARDWSRNAADATYGSWFIEPTAEYFINNACRDLLLHLGMLARRSADGQPPPPLDHDPRTWTDLPKVLRANVQ